MACGKKGCQGGCGKCSLPGPGACSPNGNAMTYQGGGQSPARTVERFDQIAAADYTGTIYPDLSSLKDVDELGRHIQVAGIGWSVLYQYDVVAASLAAPVTGYQQLSLVDNVFLRDSLQWQYFSGLDFRSIRDDVVMRDYRLLMPDPDTIPDADATNLQVRMDFYMPFTLHDWHGPTIPGSIPLKLLTEGSAEFKFDVNTAIAGGAIAGLTQDGVVAGSTVNFYADLLHLPFASYMPWQLTHDTMPNLNGVLDFCDRYHEYAAIRYLPEDTGGQAIDNIANFYAQANGYQILNPISAGQDLIFHNRMWIASEPDADFTLFVDSSGVPTFLPITTQHRHPIPASPFGKINFSATSRGDQTQFRFLHRTIGAAPNVRYQEVPDKLCMPVGTRAVAKGAPGVYGDPCNFPGAEIRFIPPTANPGVAMKADDVLI